MSEPGVGPFVLASAEATEAAGAALAAAVASADTACIFLHGELGAGKTTFARGFLAGLGHAGRVPSPTYTLVEPYEVSGRSVWHLDLYRLGDGAELEFLGLDEMAGPGAVLLIEWPERGAGYLPNEDLSIELKVIPEGRSLAFSPLTAAGAAMLKAFSLPGQDSAGRL